MQDSKVAVVTGAASGIGRAIALRLAADGKMVVGIDLNRAGLEETAGQIRGCGKEFLAETFDLFEVDNIPGLVEGIIRRLGRTDILVNCAYFSAHEEFLDISLDENWDRQIRVNLSALIALSQCCARDMEKRKWGRIINISSVSADRGIRAQAVYCMVKAAVNSLTRSMAISLGPLGIRVNAISPAYIATSSLDEMSKEGLQRVRQRMPVQRLGRPEEIASIVGYLASEEADYCTGGIFAVDGGYSTIL